ncbi:lipase/acyltransferase domain-containing protein [Acaryochloris marina NIES-2412]|uniref:lipase/acyltransferase domain-containing protein n=1 Tax=Acaryochloris marina TaxID=155978 RepID=UPI004059FAD8
MSKLPIPYLIVLLLGILGSVLKKNNQVIWGYSGSAHAGILLTGGAKLRESLALHEEPLNVDDLEDGIIASTLMPDLHLLPGFWKIDGYTTIFNRLNQRFDLTPGGNFFTFPYDWRFDNRVAARRLACQSKDWLHKWREQSGYQDAQLILLAHSMEGLVSRYFLEVLEGWKEAKTLITFGTPYRGSLNALDVLANGLRQGLMNLLDLTKLDRDLTSVYQLLPIYNAYDSGNDHLVKVGQVGGILYVHSQNAAEALKFHTEIQSSVTTHQQLEGYHTQGYSIYPIVGLGQTTQQSARFHPKGEDLFTEIEGKELSGDSTVPRVSAILIEMINNTNAMYAATQHGSLQNVEAVLAHLEGILRGLELDLGDFKKGYTVSLTVEDLFFSGESVKVEANTVKADAELTAALWRTGKTEPVVVLPLTSGEGSSHQGRFKTLHSGSYRVQVSGEGVETVSDSFTVAEILGMDEG